MKYAIFDLEIINAIPPKNEADRLPEITYCSGWGDFKNMGISAASFCHESYFSPDPLPCFDSYCWIASDPAFPELLAEKLKQLKADGFLIGGFNSRKFDDKLLAAEGIIFTSDFDVLEMVLEAAGMKGKKYWEDGRSYSLDSITKANGLTKTGNGADAPIWWQQGEREKVRDYCRNDAEIEMAVLNLLLSGDLVDPNTQEKLHFSN